MNRELAGRCIECWKCRGRANGPKQGTVRGKMDVLCSPPLLFQGLAMTMTGLEQMQSQRGRSRELSACSW